MVRVRSIPRRSVTARLANAARRRAAYAFSRLTVGQRPPAAEAALNWLVQHGWGDGLPAPRRELGVGGQGSGVRENNVSASQETVRREPHPPENVVCSGITGGAISTALAFGQRELACRWARWLQSVQLADGAFPDAGLRRASLFNTAHAARGLLAIESELPHVHACARRACEYLLRRLGRHPGFGTSGHETAREPAIPSPLYLACLPPLLTAARRWREAEWEAFVWQCVEGCLRAGRCLRWDGPSHLLALGADALADLGCAELAIETLRLPAAMQARDGSVQATFDAGWVSSAGLAQLALGWYKLGQRRQADRAMECLGRHQNPSGGFCGSWGHGAAYYARQEIAWTAKHFLDAALMQIETAFEANGADLPDTIDADDGRMRAVRAWAEGLGPRPRIADVGCGAGRFLEQLRGIDGVRLAGVDISPRLLAALPAGVEARRGSMLRVPAADGEFDGAFAVESLEHSLVPEQAIEEMCRIVRPCGQVLVIDKNRARQPLSYHEPWERWFEPAEVCRWLARHCDDVTVEPIAHGDRYRADGLFLAWSGTRR